MINFDIDYVFPYVNNKEPVWRKSFKDYCTRVHSLERLNSIDGERYEDLDLLEFLILGIEKNLPWIRKVHLIVSNIEQVPPYLKLYDKLNIVLHKDIIPEQYLPTFNSTTIEMYLRRIPGLAEHFIYGNDDMYPISPLKPEDFFTEDGKIKLNIKEYKLASLPNQFRKVCYNNYKSLIECFGFKAPDNKNTYYKPDHSINPMIKSHCSKVIEECGKNIFKHVSAFRTDKQHNQYIYPLYEYCTNNVVDTEVVFKYISYKKGVDGIVEAILDPEIDVICINDVHISNRSEFNRNAFKIKDAFKKRLDIS